MLIISLPTVIGDPDGCALGVVLSKIRATDGGSAAWVFPYQDDRPSKLVLTDGSWSYMSSEWYYRHENHVEYDYNNPVRVLSDTVKPPRTITIGKYVFSFSWNKRPW